MDGLHKLHLLLFKIQNKRNAAIDLEVNIGDNLTKKSRTDRTQQRQQMWVNEDYERLRMTEVGNRQGW